MIRVLSPLAVAVICVVVAGALDGESALVGACVGAVLAAVLCAFSYFLLRWARRASGQAVLAAMLGSVLVSFAFILVSMIVLAAVWREILVPASLTCVLVYLSYRFCEGLQSNPVRETSGSRL